MTPSLPSLNPQPAASAGALDDLAALQHYARSGDPRAFEALAQRYQAMVLAVCRRTLRNDADAEDAAQETFLKLARSAGRIRSNAGAWLHACAMHVSLDLLRKRASLARADRATALNAEPSSPADEFDAAWRDIEPLLDAALAELPDADRDLIVARFLVGRPQTELAAAAGISPGAMHRRIDKALDRLRTRLARRIGPKALAISSAGALAAALGYAASTGTPPVALAAAVAKIGLANMASHGALPAAGVKGSTIAAFIGAGIALITGASFLLMNGGGQGGRGGINGSTALAPSAGQAAAPDFERPTARSDRFSLALELPYDPGTKATFTGNRLNFEFSESGRARVDGVTAKTASFDPGKGLFASMIIQKATVKGRTTTMELTIDSINMPPGNPFHDSLTSGLNVAATVTGRRIQLQMYPPGGKLNPDNVGWLGSRVPEGATPPPDPLANPALTITPLDPTLGLDPKLAGQWFEASNYDLELSNSDIKYLAQNFQLHRYRILQWTGQGDVARVQAICADSFNPSLIGKRVKLLIRRETDGFTIAMHNEDSPRINEWPAGFERDPKAKPSDQLTIRTFRKDAP